MSSHAREIANQLQATYEKLLQTFALLDEQEIEAGTLPNGWSPKALMAHVAFWDEYQRARMQAALAGTSATAGIDRPLAHNDERAMADLGRAWPEVICAADRAREQLIAFAQTLEDSQLTADYPEGKTHLSLQRLLEQLVHHTRVHTQELRRYCGSMQRWAKPDLRKLLVTQHANLLDGISGLTEQAIITTQIDGTGSIRDLLVHVLSWNEYGLRVLQQWPDPASGTLAAWLDGKGIDEINANLLTERAALNMIDVCDGLATCNQRTLRLFDQASDEQLRGLGNYGWGEEGTLANFFYSLALHEAEHADQLWCHRATVDGQSA